MIAPRRRGMTLVEIMVFGGLALFVVAAAGSLLGDSFRRARNTQTKLEGVQANLILSLTLERDLERLYEGQNHRIEFRTGPDASSLKFFRMADTSAEGEWDPLEVVEVEYAFDGASGKVSRREGSRTDVLPGVFERVSFRLADPVDPSTLPPGVLAEAPSVIFSAVAIGEATRARAESERRGPERAVIVGGVGRRRVADRNAYPEIQPVPYTP